jgi:hypothetical protein
MSLRILVLGLALVSVQIRGAIVTGEIVDADSGTVLPARIYIQSQDGKWFFPKSAAKEGSAFELRRQTGVNAKSVEMHTTLSAHPFTVELPAGRYTLRAERGKEYFPAEEAITVGEAPASVKLKLKRWINMAERGWFSGDTHSHRPLTEMTNVILAEGAGHQSRAGFCARTAGRGACRRVGRLHGRDDHDPCGSAVS